MLHTLHNKIQRVSDLITEYDEDEDFNRNPNPALHDFVQKLKVILNANNQITQKNGTKIFNSDSNTNDIASASFSSSSQIDVSHSNTHPKVIEALGNHVVLTEIFKCGSLFDLKNFRLVNKQWKGIANSAIIQRRLWKLSFKEKLSAYNSNRNAALSELNECIEASGGSLPLTSLDFSNVDDYDILNSAALLRFYSLIGQSIKQVKFNNFGPLTLKDFQDLLVSKMPNVDHIDAGNIVFTSQEGCPTPVPVVLPYLKTVRIIHHNDENEHKSHEPFKVLPYYRDLLLAATNLKEIQDFRVQLTDAVLKTGKMDCIQKYNFPFEMKISPQCIQFSTTEPKLTSLSITPSPFGYEDDDDEDDFTLDPELAQSLEKILISSKDTLKHLQLLARAFPVDFELPKFPNLEILTVLDDAFDCDADKLSRVLPAGCDCGDIFPNLHTVLLNVSLYKDGTLHKYFPGQAFPSVKSLEFQGNFQLGSSLKIYFPNVSHLKIIDSKNRMTFTKTSIINKGFHSELDNQIEFLEFHQLALAGLAQEFELDSLFTGVPGHVCKKLLKLHKDCKARDEKENIVFVREILEVVQVQNYKFRNSKGLRRLKIIFDHEDNAHFRINENAESDLDSQDGSSSGNEGMGLWNAVISAVSCVYGFSLMPNLEEVIIGYDHYLPNASDIAQFFKPFAQFPYVKIVHETTKPPRDE